MSDMTSEASECSGGGLGSDCCRPHTFDPVTDVSEREHFEFGTKRDRAKLAHAYLAATAGRCVESKEVDEAAKAALLAFFKAVP